VVIRTASDGVNELIYLQILTRTLPQFADKDPAGEGGSSAGGQPYLTWEHAMSYNGGDVPFHDLLGSLPSNHSWKDARDGQSLPDGHVGANWRGGRTRPIVEESKPPRDEHDRFVSLALAVQLDRFPQILDGVRLTPNLPRIASV
jgi:hypothetical protein